MFIDSHAHLQFEDYGDKLDQIISDAQTAGVEKFINIGTSLADSQEAINLAQKRGNIFATVGIHPNDNPQATAENLDWKLFEELASLEKVVGIGECGLDYSRLPSTDYSLQQKEKYRQKKLFEKQIELAQKLNLPLSIHIRDAQEDVMNEFGEQLKNSRGVFHCFSGDQQYLDFVLGLESFFVSFAGNLTFKNANQLRELAREVPMEKLLIETDCPFLAPEPVRGTQNVPANVKYVAMKLAEIKGVKLDEAAKFTKENTERLFRV